MLGELGGGDDLEVVAAVKDLLQGIGIPDGEGAATQNVGLSRLQTVRFAGIQIFDLLAGLLAVRQNQLIGINVLVITPLAGIALVGGDQVVLTTDGDHRNAVWHVHTINSLVADVDLAILIQVQSITLGRVILEAQTLDVFPGTGGQIQGCNGVVLLQGDISGLAVGGNGNELRLQIHAGSRAALEQNAVFHQLRAAAVKGFKGDGLNGLAVQIHHGDRAHGIGGFIALSGFALIGRQDAVAVG